MAIDPAESLRRSLTAVLKAHGLTVSGWCKRAEIPEGTLRNFLKGRSETLTFTSLASLAKAIDEPISSILGETPSSAHDYVSIDREVKSTWVNSTNLNESEKFTICLPEDLRFPNIVHSGAIIKDDSANLLYQPETIVTYVKFEDAEVDPTAGDLVLLRVTEQKPLKDDDLDCPFGIGGAKLSQLSIRRIINVNDDLWLTSCAKDPLLFPPLLVPKTAKLDHDGEHPYQMPPYFFNGDFSYWFDGLINASYRREGAQNRTQRVSHSDAIED